MSCDDRFIPSYDSSPSTPSKLNDGIANVTAEGSFSASKKAIKNYSESTYKILLSTILTPEKKTINSTSLVNNPFLNSSELAVLQNSKITQRFISDTPTRILQAPNFEDDFYVNILDWSIKNEIAVVLGHKLYLMNTLNNSVRKLFEFDGTDRPTSIRWHPQGSTLAVGTSQGFLQLWDVTLGKKLHSYRSHKARLGVSCWNEDILTTGSKDRSIVHHDMRVAGGMVKRISKHVQEVCGLKWCRDGKYLASGGNDNSLFVWHGIGNNNSEPMISVNEHSAAVRALSWSPTQKMMLASGSGANDRKIRFFNIAQGGGESVTSVDTGSQVCNLHWCSARNEIISAHGFNTNEVVIWKMPGVKPIANLTGHSKRILHFAVSPDENSIVTGAADDTLRMWNIASQKSRRMSFDAIRSQR